MHFDDFRDFVSFGGIKCKAAELFLRKKCESIDLYIPSTQVCHSANGGG